MKDAFKIAIIFVVFMFSFEYLIAPKFNYMGFKDDFNEVRFSIALLILFISLSIFIFIKDDFIKFVTSLLLVFVTLPNLVTYTYMGGDIRIPIWSLLCIVISVLVFKLSPKLSVPTLSDSSIEKLLWILLLLCLFPVVLAHGVKFNLDVFLFDVYDVRRESRQSNTFASVYGYFWLAKVVCPIGIIFSLERKKRLIFFVFSLVLMYLFMTTGHKSVFLSVFIILALYFGRPTYKNKTNYFITGCLGLFLSLRLLSELSGFILPESLLIRRLFFIPAMLNIYYFDFFDNNFTYYSSSYLSLFLDYPYDKTIPQVIGYYFFNSDEMSANNGYISDGFANLGDFGVLFNVILSALILKLFKDYNVHVRYSGLIFVTFYSFQGSALSTVLFTHGGLLLVVLIPLVLRNKNV